MQTNSDPSGQHEPPISIWVSLVIIGRVLMILVIFLTLFLAIFLGYFTLPLVMMGFIAGIYMLSDIGWHMFFKRQRPIRPTREENPSPYEKKPDERD